jgi:hypothetical protein
MSTKTSCPHCDQSLEGDGEIIGKSVDCPACGKSFIFKNWVKTATVVGPKNNSVDLSHVPTHDNKAPAGRDQISRFISDKEGGSRGSEIAEDGPKVYRKPILASIYHVLGLFMLIMGGVVLVVVLLSVFLGKGEYQLTIYFSGSITALVAGLVTYGIGQVFDHIGRTAFYSELSCSLQAEHLAVSRKVLSKIGEKN